jgi:hypothetical protein
MVAGIPNSWPFKEELLQELELAKAKMEERKQMAKERRKLELVRGLNRECGLFCIRCH